MPSTIRKYFIGISILLTSTFLTGSIMGNTASAVVDNSPDCDNVAIIRCGAFDAETMRQKASQGDVPKIFNHMGISQQDLKGKYVDGIVWRDGRVTVDGKVVATNAMTAGRNYGGTAISGTNAGTYSTSKFVTEGQTAFVKLKADGTFDFAVIKACGNPVTGTPKVPQKETPTAAPIEVCEIFTGKIITIDKTEYNEGKHTRDLSKCEKNPIKVCNLFTNKIETIDEDDFNKGHHSKDLSRCQEKPVTPAVVKNIEVCELSTKTMTTIKETEFDRTKYSKDSADCEAPVAIASTGPTETIITGLLGSGALGYGAYAYTQSRRHLHASYKGL